jgi:GDPmannose 4,6-dehydratase
MWLILQHKTPEDFVIATGVQHSVREFATLAFHHAGIELRWEGQGIEEKGIVESITPALSSREGVKVGDVVVAVSPDFYRPTDVVNLLGDPSKAKRELGWNPQTTSFEQLVELMVTHDMKKVAADDAAAEVRKVNLAEFLEKGIDK